MAKMKVYKIDKAGATIEVSVKKNLVHRVDFMPWPEEGEDGSYMNEPMVRDTNGFLKGRAIATNVGVFPYITEDGTVLYELRPPEEVFDEDSTKSLENIPMTNDHPPVMLTPENAKDYTVGNTGDVRQDQYHLAPAITVTDEKAMEDIDNGKKALSCGYTADLIFKAGTWMGVHYDAIQTNIRYNHLAIVPKGRAGDAAKMKMDSVSSVGVQKNDIGGKSSMENEIRIDGLTYKVDKNASVVIENKLDELKQAKTDVETKTAELTKVKTDLEATTAKYDQLKEDNEKLASELEKAVKADHSEAVNKAIKDRLALVTVADKAGVEVKDTDTNDEIKKAVILKVSPSAKEKLDSCESTYLDARFDAVAENVTDTSHNNAFKGDSKGSDDSSKDHKDDKKSGEVDSDKARQDMIDRYKNASKSKEA